MNELRASGEVSEREELLDGRFQVVLDGVAEANARGNDAAIEVSVTLVWLLGREGGVPLDEGYVTLVLEGGGEVNASLESGDVEESAETGASVVRGVFAVDAVEGEVGDLASAASVRCELEVGAESWSGELRLEGGAG